jgi:hypothetical protein
MQGGRLEVAEKRRIQDTKECKPEPYLKYGEGLCDAGNAVDGGISTSLSYEREWSVRIVPDGGSAFEDAILRSDS